MPAHPFLRLGEVAQLGSAGYSGAAIVKDGRVHAIFSGIETRGLWFLEHVSRLIVVPASNVERPWRTEPGDSTTHARHAIVQGP